MSVREEWVVAIRLRQLGDVLAALDSVRALRQFAPQRRVAYVVDAPFDQVLKGLAYIDRVMVAPRRGGALAWIPFVRQLRALHPVAAVDFHGSARSALISLMSGAPMRAGYDVRGRGLAYTVREPRGEFHDGVRIPHTPLVWGARLARHAGAAAAGSVPPALRVEEKSREQARTRLIEAGVDAAVIDGGRLVGLNPGRPVASKFWAPGRFADLARAIAGDGGQALVMWGPGEEALAQSIASQSGAVVSPSFALRDVTGALANLAALVSIDSGLKHLAVCARVPTVTVFGSTDPREWHMGGARDAYLWKGLSCSPCRRLSCPYGAPCMDLAVDDVMAVLRRTLAAAA